ncbi:unnamed protein product [Mycena citricolor]|uniref:DUF6534 domain-containing protein n=1 Tax=Mycena citricolor TaxID=2018698 RepID=A0AAD2H032_9AGAR|nr:unnamed protein product [Mycena citricolor]CAK5273771.1 unnamed protein product [Mycena citricolor]
MSLPATSHLLDKTSAFTSRVALSVLNTLFSLGVGFIGVVVAAGLYGGLPDSSNLSDRSSEHPASLLRPDLVVALVMIFDTIHQALISHTVYTYLVTNYSNRLDGIASAMFLDSSNLALCVICRLSRTISHLQRSEQRQHMVYCHRYDSRIGRIRLCPWFVHLFLTLLSGLESFVPILAYVILSMQLETFAQLTQLKTLSIMVNTLAAAGDVFIAATLCTLLHRSRTGFHRSDTMIKKLIMFAVNTGLVTSLCAIASLISVSISSRLLGLWLSSISKTVVAGNTFIYILFFFCMGRLYCNSLLATLNARKMIRSAADGVNHTSENASLSLREFHPKNSSLSMTSKRPNISIKIDTTHEFNRDGDSTDPEKFATQSAAVRFELSHSPRPTHRAPPQSIQCYTLPNSPLETTVSAV